MGRGDTLGMDLVGLAVCVAPRGGGVGVRNLGVSVGARVGATLLLCVVVKPPVGVPPCCCCPLPSPPVLAFNTRAPRSPAPAVTDTEGESKLGEEERLGRGELEGAEAEGVRLGLGDTDTI